MVFYVMFCVFIKAYVVGTHLNCIDDAILMGTHNICLYKEVDKKYTGCNLKTVEFLDCVGVCVVIRLNTINTRGKGNNHKTQLKDDHSSLSALCTST